MEQRSRPRGGREEADGGREEAEAEAVELIFYNKDTHESKTGEEMSRSWQLLDPTDERNADYEHPAYYNFITHYNKPRKHSDTEVKMEARSTFCPLITLLYARNRLLRSTS